jgi:hypothetical protein
MTRHKPDSRRPFMVFKELLVYAVARLQAAGDNEAVEYILRELPPVDRKGGER